MSYDRADFDYSTENQPLPKGHAATHIGMFLAWAVMNGLENDYHRQRSAALLEELRRRHITGRQFFEGACGERFSERDLGPEGNAFTERYYIDAIGHHGQYLDDYKKVLATGLPSFWHVPDTWENYEKIALVISKRFQEWKNPAKEAVVAILEKPVSEDFPSVTILIAARPGQSEIKAVTASRALDYPGDRLEIIVARGKQPSVQRNAALRAARGDLIYFLDDDSEPLPQNLRRALEHFRNPIVKMVGGPNLCPPGAPALEQIFALVQASWLAFVSSRARYAQIGQVRETGEKELILCNLLARRLSLLDLGGFNEALYPNEENALMDQLRERGGKLIYDPKLCVYRRPRPSLRAFAKMLMTYGRGRAEQFRVHPTPGSVLNFVPPLFCLYLVLLVAASVFMPIIARILALPLMVYALAVLVQAAILVTFQKQALDGLSSLWPEFGTSFARRLRRGFAAIPLIILAHVLYGAGFWRGLFTTLTPGAKGPVPPVVLETVSL